MREVSCRVLGVWEHVAATHGLSFEDMVAGLPVPHDLRDKSGWIDWDVLMEVIDRFTAVLGDDALIEIGREAIRQDVVAPLRRIAGLAMGLTQLYQVGLRWQLPLLHRNLIVQVRAVNKRNLSIEIRVPAHFRTSPGWFRVLQGGLEALPIMQNLELAKVDAQISSHYAHYDVALPAQHVRLISRLTAWLRDPALVELERQVNELHAIDRERSRLEDALRERERMLSNLIANLSGMVYRCAREDFDFDFVSERCLELTGYRADELIGGSVSYLDLVHPADLPGLREKRSQSFRSQQPASQEYRLRTRAGETRWILDVARAVHDAKGRLTGIEGFMTDVTDRKRLEEDLVQAQRVEGIGRLAGGIAHDFNNLLTVILGSVELAQSAVKSGPALTYIDHVRSAAERAATLTQQLLAFARKQVIEPRIVDLNSLVLGMSTLLSRALIEDIELKTELSKGLWTVEVDPGQFEQVLLNLAINARDAMPQGGLLTLETANIVLEGDHDALPGLAAGHYVMLAVSDTGTGMTKEVQDRAFEPFFTTKDVGQGTGLGLASSHGIVRQAGGQILLSSELGKGTEFRIYLPRAEGVEPPTEQDVEEQPQGEHHGTVLVVEDHDMVRGMIANTLQAQGYDVRTAAQALDALAAVSRGEVEPDLLLVDILMPQMKGTELAEKLRELRPTLPVIYMSGYSEQLLGREQLLGVATSFLKKPFTSISLVRKVHDALEPQRAPESAPGEKTPHLRIVK
ncbi:MAG: response regulator [Myxococcales bacterium]